MPASQPGSGSSNYRRPSRIRTVEKSGHLGIANFVDNVLNHFSAGNVCAADFIVVPVVFKDNGNEAGRQFQQFQVIVCEVPDSFIQRLKGA